MQACWSQGFGIRGIFTGDDVGSEYRGELNRTFSPDRMGLQRHPRCSPSSRKGGLASTAKRSALIL